MFYTLCVLALPIALHLLIQMYLTKHKIEYNWRFAEIQQPDRLKTLKGHDDHVVIVFDMYFLL